MLQNINLNTGNSFKNRDKEIAKNVVDLLFIFVGDTVKNDKKMSGFTKGIIARQLPGIRKGSNDCINEMNPLIIKKLLDDIQSQLKMR